MINHDEGNAEIIFHSIDTSALDSAIRFMYQRVTNNVLQTCRTRNRRDYAASIDVPMDFVPMHLSQSCPPNPVSVICLSKLQPGSQNCHKPATPALTYRESSCISPSRCNSPHDDVLRIRFSNDPAG